MKFLQRFPLRYALAACTAAMTACTSPGYNDNPSQRITKATVGCPAATENFAVHFSVRVQPADEQPGETLNREMFLPYCSDIPSPGRVFLTADLVGDELRRIPVAIRIVRQDTGKSRSDESDSAIRRTLFDLPATAYPNGVVETSFELTERGHYAIHLIRRGDEAISGEDVLRIPLNVGSDPDANRAGVRNMTVVFGALALAVIGMAIFRYLLRRSRL